MKHPLDVGPASSSSDESGRRPQEIEIKFKTDQTGLKQILSSPHLATGSAPRAQNLRTVYFDTPAGDLSKNGIVFRVRKAGRAAPVLGIKMAENGDDLFSRMEVEVRAPDMRPNLSLFEADLAAMVTHLVDERRLGPRFETQVKRRTILVESGLSRIEIALDEGVVIAGQNSHPLAEVELELKSGDEATLYDLAISLAQDLPLRLDFVSKGERGFRFSAGEGAAPAKAAPMRFAKGASVDDIVSMILSSNLLHFVRNWAALREIEHPESIHQMRVALRRMRTALAIFNHALPCSEFEVLRADAKRIASGLGPARDCDVFLESAGHGPLAHPDRPAHYDKLLAAIDDRRVEAYRGARGLIEDVGTTLFVLRVQSLLARRAWRNALVGPELATLTGRAADFAADALDRLRGRTLNRGKGLRHLADDERHELRIALKNLRYGAEFFSELFGHRGEVEAFIRAVSELQRILGALNDAVTARQFLETLTTNTSPEVEKVSGFILGWNARGAFLADNELAAAWKIFKKGKLFWMRDGKR